MKIARGMTLMELMVVGAIGVTVAAATMVNIVEQVRRTRAVDAARSAIHPHTVARDRAVASRLCTETILIPRLGQPFTPPAENGPSRFPADAQRSIPRIAVVEWSDCNNGAVITRVDFFDLDGEITLAPYDSADERAVFGPEGGLTSDRPGPVSGFAPAGERTMGCQPPRGPGGEGAAEGEGEGECRPPPSKSQEGPPTDITFSATTYFGQSETYRIYARVGATEHLE
jgi:type II secretory pathway pseudopilin PulG